MDLKNIPYLRLNVDIDLDKLKFELSELNRVYNYAEYKSIFFGAKRKYRKAWSGISLWGSGGELYSDFSEGTPPIGETKPTELRRIMPYTYSIIEKIYGDEMVMIRDGENMQGTKKIQKKCRKLLTVKKAYLAVANFAKFTTAKHAFFTVKSFLHFF